MRKTIGWAFLGIIIAFLLLWGALDKIIIPSSSPSNINNSEWIVMTSTFFAGTLGGFIALISVFAQLNHEKNEKKKRVIKYLKYIVKSNLDLKDLHNKLALVEVNISYVRDHFGIENPKKLTIFNEFYSEYFNNNLDVVLSLENGEKIIKLNRGLNNLNNSYTENFKINRRKKKLLEDFTAKTNIPFLCKILTSYSDVLDFFPYKYKSILLYLEKQKELFAENNNFFFQTDVGTFIDDLIQEIKENGEEKFGNGEFKLEIVTKYNQFFLENLSGLFSLYYSDNEVKEIADILFHDFSFTGQALNILKELQAIQIK